MGIAQFTGPVVTLRRAALLLMGIAFAAVPASAQWTLDEAAKNRCADQLTYQISQEVGGKSPDSGIDRNGAQISRLQNGDIRVIGNGWYRRDAYDRGRPYEYTCAFNGRNGATDATYRWAGDFAGSDDYNPPASNGNRPGGRVVYRGGIVNVHSGKALDAFGETPGDAVDVRQRTFRNRPSQLWDITDAGRGLFVIVSQGSNKVLDVEGNLNRDGADVMQWRYNGSDPQLWRIERVGNGAFQLVNVASGKCLDVQAMSKEDGANVRQWKCVGAANQAWRLGQ